MIDHIGACPQLAFLFPVLLILHKQVYWGYNGWVEVNSSLQIIHVSVFDPSSRSCSRDMRISNFCYGTQGKTKYG